MIRLITSLVSFLFAYLFVGATIGLYTVAGLVPLFFAIPLFGVMLVTGVLALGFVSGGIAAWFAADL